MEARIHDSSLAASLSDRTPLLQRHGEVHDQKVEATPLRYGEAHPPIHLPNSEN